MTMQDIEIRNLAEMELLPPLTKLQEALIKAGVRILHSDDVAEYKRQKFNRELEKMLAAPKPVPGWRAVAWMALLCLTMFGNGALAIALEMQGRTPALVIPALAMLAACVGIFREINRQDRISSAWSLAPLLEWREYPVGSCGAGGYSFFAQFTAPGTDSVTVLPSGAHEAAEALHRAGAEAQFFVDQLDTDPFLWVQSIDRPYERYCIFAWDEDGFIPQA